MFTHRSESSEPHVRFPSLGVWHQEEEPPEHLALKTSGLVFRRSTGWRETETPLFEGTHKVSCALGPWAKQWLHRSLGQTYLWVLEALLGRRGSAVAHCRGKDTGGRDAMQFSSEWAPLVVTILALRPGPTQQPEGSSAGTPQAKQPTAWEHRPTHQQTGCLKLSWTHSHL